MSTYGSGFITRVGKVLTGAALAAAVAVSSLFVTLPVNAAGGSVEMSTSYPGISTKPGQDVTFDLDFDNRAADGTSVELSSSGLPKGWSDEFTGGGRKISAVYVKSGEQNALVTYKVTIPDDTAKGTYNVTIRGNQSALKLTFDVTDEETGDSGLTTDDTTQEGPTGTTFSYSVTLQNNSAADQTYALSAKTADGWSAVFKPADGSNDVASIDVAAHASATLNVKVTPPEKVAAGDYEIPISAVSSEQNLSATLKAKITGTYGVEVTTSDQTLSFNANAGHEKDVPVKIHNTGNIDLSAVALSVTAPDGWDASFDTGKIATIAAGDTADATLKVTPSKNAVSGDYALTVSASNDNTSSDASFRATVKTGTAWGIAGVVIIVAVIALLMGIIRKFGRH
jgi:uncharacterized membrane protein